MSIHYTSRRDTNRTWDYMRTDDLVNVYSDDVQALIFSGMHVHVAKLHRFKKLWGVRFRHCTFDADAWPSTTITTMAMHSCDIPAALGALSASLTSIQLYDCSSAAWEAVMDRVARSNVRVMHFRGEPGRHLVMEMLPRSKITEFEFVDFLREDVATVRTLVRTAETCDVERLVFGIARYTLKFPKTWEYKAEVDSALAVHRVLVVLSARSGPALRFLKRDGDNACLARTLKYM